MAFLKWISVVSFLISIDYTKCRVNFYIINSKHDVTNHYKRFFQNKVKQGFPAGGAHIQELREPLGGASTDKILMKTNFLGRCSILQLMSLILLKVQRTKNFENPCSRELIAIYEYISEHIQLNIDDKNSIRRRLCVTYPSYTRSIRSIAMSVFWTE